MNASSNSNSDPPVNPTTPHESSPPYPAEHQEKYQQTPDIQQMYVEPIVYVSNSQEQIESSVGMFLLFTGIFFPLILVFSLCLFNPRTRAGQFWKQTIALTLLFWFVTWAIVMIVLGVHGYF